MVGMDEGCWTVRYQICYVKAVVIQHVVNKMYFHISINIRAVYLILESYFLVDLFFPIVISDVEFSSHKTSYILSFGYLIIISYLIVILVIFEFSEHSLSLRSM